jgi:hypothetical protein
MREKKVLEAAVMYEDRGDNGKLSEPTITSGADQSAAGDGPFPAGKLEQFSCLAGSHRLSEELAFW